MIEPLPIEFKSHQRAFRQLARKGIVALYELRNLKANHPHQLIGFELIIIRYQKAQTMDSWSFPERERYPTAEQFGRYAWSLPSKTRELAELLFDQLASMPFGSVKPLTDKDNYIGWNNRANIYAWRSTVREILTGRPLPKSGKISNRTKPATERLTPN